MLKNNLRHLFKHSFIYSIGWAASVFAGIIMLPIYSKYLSRADYGAIDLVQQMNAVLKIVFMSGLNTAVAKFYHEAEDFSAKSRTMSTNVIMVSILGLAACSVCYGFNYQISSYVFGNTEYVHLVNIGAITLFFDLLFMGLITQYYISEDSGEFVKLNLIKLVTAIAANLILVVWYKMGASGMLFGNLISYVPVTFIAGTRCFHRYGKVFDIDLLRKMIRFGFPLVPATLLATVMHSADRFLLRSYGSLDQVGILTMGLNFPSMLNSVLLTSFNSIWLSSSIFLIAKNSDAENQTSKIATYFMIVFCGLQAALGIFSTSIMQVLVDNKFYVAHAVIPITCMGFCFHALYTFITVAAYTKNKTTLMIYAYAIPVLFKLVASYFFIKYFGYFASAWIITATYLIFTIVCYFLFKKIAPVHFEFQKLAVLFISCSIAMTIAYSIKNYGFIERGLFQVGIFASLITFFWFGPFFSTEEKVNIISESRRYLRSKLSGSTLH